MNFLKALLVNVKLMLDKFLSSYNSFQSTLCKLFWLLLLLWEHGFHGSQAAANERSEAKTSLNNVWTGMNVFFYSDWGEIDIVTFPLSVGWEYLNLFTFREENPHWLWFYQIHVMWPFDDPVQISGQRLDNKGTLQKWHCKSLQMSRKTPANQERYRRCPITPLDCP